MILSPGAKSFQPIKCPHFALAGKRGRAAPTLVDYILVAEFDIDSGRCARRCTHSSRFFVFRSLKLINGRFRLDGDDR